MENLEICEGYKDENGNQYYVGDIVFNSCFRDLWLVDKYTNEEMENYETECPYCLKLWMSADQHIMDLDEPSGFIIEKHKNDEGYEDLYNKCLEILKEIEEEFNE